MTSIHKDDKILTSNFLALFGAVYFLFISLDYFIPVFPFYVIDVGGGEAVVGLLMGLFTFCSVIFRPFMGRELNRLGRKRLLLMGISLYAAAGLGLLFLPSLGMLLLIRAIQGVGWGAFLLTFNTLALDMAPAHRKGEALGLMSVAPPLSLAIAPMISENVRIVSDSNYFLLFLIPVFVAIVSLLIASLIKEPKLKTTDTYKGALLSRKVLFPSLAILFMTYNLGVIFTFLPLLGENRGIETVGFFFTVFALTSILIRPIAGRLSDRLGRAEVFLPSIVIASSGLVTIAFSYSIEALLLSAFLFGIGFGSGHASIMAMAADNLPVVERGVGIATFTASFDLGIVLGSMTFGVLLGWFSFASLFILCGILTLMPLFLYFLRFRLRRRTVTSNI